MAVFCMLTTMLPMWYNEHAAKKPTRKYSCKPYSRGRAKVSVTSRVVAAGAITGIFLCVFYMFKYITISAYRSIEGIDLDTFGAVIRQF